jgi:hypothetical protein
LVTEDGQTARADSRVPLVRLLANPSAFQLQKVETTGYINLVFEGTALYLSEEAYLHFQRENAIDLIVDEADVRSKLNGAERGWVELDGIFSAYEPGQSYCVVGVIDVQNIGPWPPLWADFPKGDPRSTVRPQVSVTHDAIAAISAAQRVALGSSAVASCLLAIAVMVIRQRFARFTGFPFLLNSLTIIVLLSVGLGSAYLLMVIIEPSAHLQSIIDEYYLTPGSPQPLLLRRLQLSIPVAAAIAGAAAQVIWSRRLRLRTGSHRAEAA